MTQTARRGLVLLLVPLLAFIALMQHQLDPLRQKFQPGRVTSIQLGGELIAATLIGMKEVVAGLLWVRADEFFHSGNYEAVIPVVRIVTWLDPHQMDVYDTGAWHLAYNFTDSQERSDRRYIPPAKALLREGISNNPDNFDLYFNLGWMNFHKIQDAEEAIKWLKEANLRKFVDPATGKTKMRPQFVGHSLAHAYEKAGRIDDAIGQWQDNLRRNHDYVERYPEESGNDVMIDVATNNLRRVQRQKELRSKIKPVKDVNFEANWAPLGPRKFRVWGTLDLPDGSRVRLEMKDKSFKEESFETFNWNVNTNQTILVDDLYVRDGKFSRTIDIERDARIYPLKADEYDMTLSFNPLNAPDYVQGVRAEDDEPQTIGGKPQEYGAIGWKGSGLADQPYLVQRDGVRMLEKSFSIDRSQLL